MPATKSSIQEKLDTTKDLLADSRREADRAEVQRVHERLGRCVQSGLRLSDAVSGNDRRIDGLEIEVAKQKEKVRNLELQCQSAKTHLLQIESQLRLLAVPTVSSETPVVPVVEPVIEVQKTSALKAPAVGASAAGGTIMFYEFLKVVWNYITTGVYPS